MPTTERQAKAYPDAPYWHAAALAEKHSLLETGTFQYLGHDDLPDNCNVVRTKVVYDVKTKSDGSIDKYKCRLVAKGFSQAEGIDFDDTFAPVSQLLSMRVLLADALAKGLTLHHLDVSTAFLASPIENS